MDKLDEKQTILIVDDSPENITVLGALLRTDYNIRVATNGEKALKIMESDNLPDLILLDVMMPGIDGYEVCRKLKTDFRTQNIPVIFITAKTSEEDEVKGFAMGAVDYVMKPFSPVVIKARVRTHMELKRYRDFLVDTSYCDGLTAIANRRRFDEYYATLWNLAIREASPLSLIMIDIDHFKQFNDHYGHQEGDISLIQIAQVLSGSLKRKTDLVARYGGEEFVCVLPDTRIDGAVHIAETFQTGILSLQIPHAFSTTSSCVTISQGIACLVPTLDSSPKALIMAADEALYKAKESGRNRINLISIFK
jgi:diguanylate cyclase (GGDEF)-like protein